MNRTDEMDIELDIISIIYRVLKHWRLLIISMIIGGVLLNGYSYYKSKKTAEAIQNTINDYQEKLDSGVYDKNGNTVMSLPDFEENLTERQINEVNNLVSTYKMYQGPYSNTVEYINNSILMQIDPESAPTYIIQYMVDTHYSVEYPEITKKDYTVDIINSIPIYLITNENLTEISETISTENNEISSSYIQELITTSADNDIFTITINGRDKTECEQIVSIIKDKMPTIFKKLKTQYNDFDYFLINESYFETYDKNIQSMQQARADELNNIYKTTNGMIQNLTDDQKSYFYALLNNEDTISVELPVEANSSEQEIDPSTLEVPSIQKISVKYIIVGIFAGVIVSCGIIICSILLSGKLICNDDIEKAFGISQLGVLRTIDTKKRLFSWIDKLLIKALNSKGELDNPEEGINRIVKDISLSASKNKYDTIFLATTSRNEQTTNIIDSIAEKIENCSVKKGNSLYDDSESLENLINSDAVVIFEHMDISKLNEIRTEYNILKRYNIPIIGYVSIR